MSYLTRSLALAILLAAIAFATGRTPAEKGARGHRIRLTAHSSSACAIADDGTVFCWGNNLSGQLGDGTKVPRPTPVAVSGLGPSISIAMGGAFACALSATGAVSCWGDNSLGQLGNGSMSPSTTPVAVIGLSLPAVSIATGVTETCAVRVDGTVWCWGDDGVGHSSLKPAQISGVTGAVSVVVGSEHACALLANGAVSCWGGNGNFQLGVDANTKGPILTSPLSITPGVGAVDLASGIRFTCARLSDGTMACWGENLRSQLGIGQRSSKEVPTPVKGGHLAVAIAAGDEFACALLADTTVSCWGRDDNAQLGDAGGQDQSQPQPPVPTITNAVEIAAGQNFACALSATGSIRCWGDNSLGQHGNGNQLPSGVDSVQKINGTFLGRGVAAGNAFTCGRRGTAAAACWGAGAQGQLGDSANASSSNPAAVTGLTNAIAITAGGGAHACALNATGAAKCWGDNSRGQLGNGTGAPSNQPVLVSSGGNIFSAISAGDLHTCAVVLSGLVRCWGAGDRGQLGGGDGSDRLVSAQVFGITNAVQVAAGNKFTCALLVDGTVQCWGDDTAGQLGDAGSANPVLTPRAVAGLSNVVGIAAGASHACAVLASGTIMCWGANGRGQIGNNSTVPVIAPTNVQGLTDAISVSAGAFFTCAVQAISTAQCWGANDAGELAAKDNVDHLTPTLVAASVFFAPTRGLTAISLSGIVAIATGMNPAQPTQEHACALLAGGNIKCWGDNLQGEIGDGTNTNRARPTTVNSFLANVDPAAVLRNGRVAEVTALINCDTGSDAHIILSLEQGPASGQGQTNARCEGRLLRVTMTVPAQGPDGFQPGVATAHVEAVVRDQGSITEDTHWTRQVVLSPSN